jgi:RND superfamily putative drug exporter
MALIFTPSLTALIGHAAWWPGHGDTKPAVSATFDDGPDAGRGFGAGPGSGSGSGSGRTARSRRGRGAHRA